MTRANVLHIVGDRKVGGIGSTLDLLQASPLAQTYEFQYLESDGNPKDCWRIIRAMQNVSIVAIHFSVRTANLPTLALMRSYASVSGIRMVLIEHHYSLKFQQVGARRPQQLRRALAIAARFVDRVIAVSPTQSKWLAEFIPDSKLSTIASCSPLKQFLDLPLKSEHQRPLKVVAFGRHTLPWKGFDVLIEAARLLVGLPIQIEIGGSGPDTEHLKQLSANVETVSIVGFVPDLGEFLASADIVVIPSRWEAWGLTCTEAKAAGKAIVASHADGLIDQSHDCGLSVPPNSSEALASALRCVCEGNRQQLQDWSRAARASVLNAEADYIYGWGELLHSLVQTWGVSSCAPQKSSEGGNRQKKEEIKEPKRLSGELSPNGICPIVPT
ncbi:MAG: glycosyltransferase family 4 protein [Cyanobacteria bacterium J06597_1]